MTRILFSDFREPAAGEAYEIAYDYLARSGIVRDEYETFVFLAQFITTMVDQGHGNRIRMANRAISAYQQSRFGRDARAAPLDNPTGERLAASIGDFAEAGCREAETRDIADVEG